MTNKPILPDHIEKRTGPWYFDTKRGKYIHADRIEAYMKRIYEFGVLKQTIVAEKIKEKKIIGNALKPVMAELPPTQVYHHCGVVMVHYGSMRVCSICGNYVLDKKANIKFTNMDNDQKI